MSDQRQGDGQDLQAQIDALSEQVKDGHVAIKALQSEADAAKDRADRSEARADATDIRIDGIEAAAALDRELIAQLQADGIVSREHAAQMESALQSSRTIGTAIGILMEGRDIGQDEAFTVLKTVSRNANRKLREVAQEMVESH